MGGTAPTEGRVEVCVNNNWGTVCDDGWTAVDAGVACMQAGFSSENAVAISSAGFGQGTGAIVLDDVACRGTESRLVDCTFNPNHNCNHGEDAGVRCQRCKQSKVVCVQPLS